MGTALALQQGLLAACIALPQDHGDGIQDGGGGRSNIDIRHLSLKTVTKIASPRAASAPQFLASPPVPNCSLDGFSQWRMVKLPNTENATAVGNRTLNECRDFCSWNCSCMMW
ncbi:hypothetical protein ZIOFF_065454 [Zingiber officinale]|uniref:Apple domain-containing protein n=1 Tax=Zingiber officinale TaxID=94328 RepID=A0A8J5EX53_ZINOF|nr:hypothetical protein ZIOFF_065454 [Zingiber officinale]